MRGNSYPPRRENPGRKHSTINNLFGADTTRSGVSTPPNRARPRNKSLKGKGSLIKVSKIELLILTNPLPLHFLSFKIILMKNEW